MNLYRRLGRRSITLALIVGAFILFGVAIAARSTDAKASSAAEAKVRAVIEKAYLNGAFNGLDTQSMAKGFHEDFAIFSARENKLARYEIGDWIEGIEKRKSAADFDPASSAMDGKIVALDVTGGAASAKIELSRDGKLVYTDYLSLLEFKDGWKMAAKVYFRHPD